MSRLLLPKALGFMALSAAMSTPSYAEALTEASASQTSGKTVSISQIASSNAKLADIVPAAELDTRVATLDGKHLKTAYQLLTEKEQIGFIKLALSYCKNSPSLRVHDLELDAARKAYKYEKNSSYYPDLKLTFGPSYSTGEPVGFFAIANDTSEPTDIDGAPVIDNSASGVVNEAKAEVDFSLYDGGKFFWSPSNKARLLQGQVAFEKATHSKSIEGAVLEIAAFLLDKSEAEAELQIYKKLLKLANEKLALIQRVADSQMVDKTKLYEAEEEIVSLNDSIMTVESTLVFLKQKLRYYFPDVELESLPNIQLYQVATLPDVDVIIEKHLASSTDLLMQQAAIDIAAASYASEKSSDGLSVSLYGNVRAVADENLNGQRSLKTVGLEVEVPITDMLRSSSRSRSAAVKHSMEIAKLNVIQQNIRFSVFDLYQDFSKESYKLSSNNAELNNSMKDLDQVKELYAHGKSSQVDVIDKRMDLEQNKLDLVKSAAKIWSLSFRLLPVEWSCIDYSDSVAR